MVECKKLCRDFKTYTKDPANFKGLFKKEKTIVFSFEGSIKNPSENWQGEFDYDWIQGYNQLKIRFPQDHLEEAVLQTSQSFPVSDFYKEKTGVEEVMNEILSHC